MRISKSEKTTVEASNWAGAKKVFDTHGGDTQLNDRTGQIVTVIRPLTGEEADIADVGPMFKVRFEDGYVTDAFEDELSDVTSSTKTSVTANKGYKDKRIREGAHKVAVAMRKALIANGHSEEEVNGLGLTDLKALCNQEDIKYMDYVEFSTSTDQALQHIKAAIDILGKSGNKDDVTKDSIANLAVVMMDLNSQK